MLAILLQVAAVLPGALDVAARPGDVQSFGRASASLIASTAEAGDAGDAAIGGLVKISIGVGPGIEVFGIAGGDTPITLGTPEPPDVTSHPNHAGPVGNTFGTRIVQPGAHAVSTNPDDPDRVDPRLGARWAIPGGVFAVRGDLFPRSGGGELRLEAWRSIGRRLAVAGYTGIRLRASDDGTDSVTWGGTAQIPVVYRLHAVAGLQGEVGMTETWNPAHAIGGLRWDVGRASLYALGGAGVIDDGAGPSWHVGFGATFTIGSTSRDRSMARAVEPPRIAALKREHEADPQPRTQPQPDATDDRIESELLESDIALAFRSVEVKLDHDEIVLAEPIFFDPNRKRVRRRFRDALDSLAAYIVAHPEVGRIRIHGHADGTGPEAWNDVLSAWRAQEVADQLVARGVPADRVETAAYGSRVPDATNETEDGRARNRRVVFMRTGEAN